MPDLGVNIVPPSLWSGQIQKWSTKRQGLVALMPNTNIDSNVTDTSTEEDVLVSYAKKGDASWALTGGQSHNLTSRHAPEFPILFSVHSAQ